VRLAHGTVALHPIVWLIAAGKLSLHLLTSAQGYGYFGDELYYLACADHPVSVTSIILRSRSGHSVCGERPLATHSSLCARCLP
jgi:hypothetical protein